MPIVQVAASCLKGAPFGHVADAIGSRRPLTQRAASKGFGACENDG
jgi:hypothetical protein